MRRKILTGLGLASVLTLALAAPAFAQDAEPDATALLGTETFFNVLSLPVLSWYSPADDTLDAVITAPRLLLYVLFFWSVDVAGFVLSRAIGRPYVVGVFIMIGYALLSISLQVSLFPPSTS